MKKVKFAKNLHKSAFTLAKGEIFVVCSERSEQRRANVKDYRYGKISFKKFCNGVADPQALENSKTGFTLAEVLLTLAVIGIVAAITLPSLLVDTTEKAFDAQRRALHARLAQAIGMMSSLSGYGTYIPDSKDTDGNDVPGKDDAAETFLYEGLSKVYKMNNICNSNNLDKCGIPASFITMAGGTMVFPKKLSELNAKLINNDGQTSDISATDTKVAAFETVNGESVAVFYNPNCKNNQDTGNAGNQGGDTSSDPNNWYDWFYTQNKMCVNFVYDLNGLKGPNKVGRDIGFITALYGKNPEVVAPIPFDTDIDETRHTQQEAVSKCTEYADNSRLPNVHELSSLFYNTDLVGNFKVAGYWSSSVISSGRRLGTGFRRRPSGQTPSFYQRIRTVRQKIANY